MFPTRVFIGVSLLLAGCFACSSTAKSNAQTNTESLETITPVAVSPVEYADQILKSNGFSQNFIDSLHNQFILKHSNWSESTLKIEELNIFGFLGHADYSVHDSPIARKKIKKYLKDHQKSFRETEKRYAVSSRSIASLMWVETKFGKITGTYPIAWVFYSMLLGSHPQFVQEMIKITPEKLAKGNPKNLTLIAAQNKVIERSKSKALWAIDELKAINQMSANYQFNPFRVKSSFAGAFGLPQFIPSTYLKFAESPFRKRPDLYKHSDAVLSVAHFLHENGWVENDESSKSKALYAYNRSRDYGDVILKLAKEPINNR